MKFTVFFLIFALILILKINIYSYSALLSLWTILNLFLMSIAYTLNKPSLILNKNIKGEINFFLLLLNLPMLVLTWVLFFVYDKLIKEDFSHQIADTNIWISRRPTYFKKINDFDMIIDLTAEFFKDKTDKNYFCLANLDGMGLKNYSTSLDIKNQTILVHCANGHGRSSLFVAILLIENNIASNVKEALVLISKSRKDAVPNREQKLWLEALYAK